VPRREVLARCWRRFRPPGDINQRAYLLLPMTTPDQLPKNFESALAELEAIVASMEDGQLPLQESLTAYARGAALLAFCQSALKEAQQQVEVLEKGVLKAFAPDGEADGP
jgi:exodeoxyribonuclease VII small subunit